MRFLLNDTPEMVHCSGYPVYFAVVEDPLGDESADLEEMADKIAKTFRDNPER